MDSIQLGTKMSLEIAKISAAWTYNPYQDSEVGIMNTVQANSYATGTLAWAPLDPSL